MKTIQSRALVAVIASLLGVAAHAQGNGNVSLGAVRSIVNPSVNDIDTRIDNSRSTDRSFNTNTSLDYQTVAPNIRTVKSIATQDTQSASNSGYMGGATQIGKQGDFNLTMGGGAPVSAQGGKYRSPVSVDQQYDLAQSNSARVGGDSNAELHLENVANLGGSMINHSDVGPKQSFYAGDQTQVQGNTLDKHSATQTNASDVVSTTVSK